MSAEKIKFVFNKSEVKALFDMLTVSRLDLISDKTKRVLIRHILEKIYFKLAKRLARQFDETSISLNQAESLTLYEVLNTVDDIELPEYEHRVKYKVTDEIHARYIV